MMQLVTIGLLLVLIYMVFEHKEQAYRAKWRRESFENPNWTLGVPDGLGQQVSNSIHGMGHGSEQVRQMSRTIGNQDFQVSMGRVGYLKNGDEQRETSGWGEFETKTPMLASQESKKRLQYNKQVDFFKPAEKIPSRKRIESSVPL